MRKGSGKRTGAGLIAPALALVLIFTLAILTGCGGGGGGTSTPTTPIPTDPTPTNPTVDNSYSGYLYAPVNVNRSKLSGGLVILQSSTAPSGYRAVSGGKAYLADSPSQGTTTDSSGYFKLDLSKGRATTGIRRVIAEPGATDENFAGTRAEVAPPFPIYEGGTIKKLLLHPNARNIEVGETIQLYAVVTVQGGGSFLLDPATVTWEVDDTSLGSVSNAGLFTGLAEGTPQVTITYEDFTCTGKVHVRQGTADTFQLSGEVVYEDGTPATGAVVIIDGIETVGVVDEDGNYAIPDLPGNVDLNLSVTVDGEVKYTKIIHLTEDTVLNIVLPLDQPGTGNLQGTVRDTAGNVLANVLVTVGDLSTTTDSSGYYLIEEIPEGSHSASYTLAGYIPASAVVQIDKNATTTKNITLQPEATPEFGNINGRVIDPQHNGIGGALVGYEYQGQTGSTTADSQGYFSFTGLEAGNYTLTAEKTGYDGVPVSVTVVDGEDTSVEITLTPQVAPEGNIAGTVKDSSGNVLAGVTVSTGSNSTTTGSDGKYSINSLDPGQYTVNFGKDGYKPVVLYATVVSGQTTTLNAVLQIDDTPTTGVIKGTIKDTDNNVLPSATVTCGSKVTTTDSQGNYSFQDCDPGVHTVTAAKYGYYGNSGQVNVIAGQESTCNISLEKIPPPTGIITGTVTDTKGLPIEGVFVSLGSNYTATTASDGTYTINDVIAGNYTASFTKTGYVPLSLSVTITADQTTTVNVMMTKIIVKSWQNVGAPGFTSAAGYYTSMQVYNDTPYVAFRDAAYGNKTSVAKFDGKSWVYVGTPGFSTGSVHDVAMFIEDGTIWVAYMDYGHSEKVVVKKYNGSSWVNVGTPGFSDYKAYYIAIAVENGTPYVAYRDQEHATVKKFNGTSWVNVGSPRFSESGVYHCSIRIDNGTPYLAYRDAGYGEKATVVKFNGTNWVYVGSPGFSDSIANNTDIDVYNGVPYVTYCDWARNGKATVMIYTGSGDTGWEAVGNAGFSPGITYYTSIRVVGGIPFVAWSDGYHVSCMAYNAGEQTWVNIGSPDFSAGNAHYVSLDVSGTIPYCAYTDYGYGGKVTVMKYDEAPGSGTK